MKLDYVSSSPTDLSAEDKAVYERVQKRRGVGGFLPLDLTLLHSPKLADVACQTTSVRFVFAAALINKAWFEWKHHAPLLEAAEGFTAEMFAVIEQLNPADQGPLSDRQWAVLRYSDAMTKDVLIPDDIFKDLQLVGFNEKEIVEITLTCTTYNMVSRFLVALDVGEANSSPPNLGSNLETGQMG
ncbi:hypothetical protein V500_07275 [Pseudogymnoascus sp. VKM F-4518 (FW-2643)]|nr:hypothetical protein V500_07275 [Pseudogymnoascus sp. VKM F-4518 (FW-2643)]